MGYAGTAAVVVSNRQNRYIYVCVYACVRAYVRACVRVCIMYTCMYNVNISTGVNFTLHNFYISHFVAYDCVLSNMC